MTENIFNSLQISIVLHGVDIPQLRVVFPQQRYSIDFYYLNLIIRDMILMLTSLFQFQDGVLGNHQQGVCLVGTQYSKFLIFCFLQLVKIFLFSISRIVCSHSLFLFLLLKIPLQRCLDLSADDLNSIAFYPYFPSIHFCAVLLY